MVYLRNDVRKISASSGVPDNFRTPAKFYTQVRRGAEKVPRPPCPHLAQEYNHKRCEKLWLGFETDLLIISKQKVMKKSPSFTYSSHSCPLEILVDKCICNHQ